MDAQGAVEDIWAGKLVDAFIIGIPSLLGALSVSDSCCGDGPYLRSLRMGICEV